MKTFVQRVVAEISRQTEIAESGLRSPSETVGSLDRISRLIMEMQIVMRQDGIKAEAQYINPNTGSVDTGAAWISDFLSAQKDGEIAAAIRPDSPEEPITWEEWGGNVLIEVVKDAAGDWVEAQ